MSLIVNEIGGLQQRKVITISLLTIKPGPHPVSCRHWLGNVQGYSINKVVLKVFMHLFLSSMRSLRFI